MANRRWRVRLAAQARRDFDAILDWTKDNFGANQARIYQKALVGAIAELTSGPNLLGSKARDEIEPGLRSLHVARNGRRGRHFLLYRVSQDGAIEIGRILHDAMELSRHLPRSKP